MDNQNQTVIQQPTSSAQTQSPIDGSSYGKRNWVKLILIYALITAVVYGAIYVLFLSKQGLNPYSASYQAPNATPQPTQVQDETANWKTYTNEKYKFSIKYPNDWEYHELETKQNVGFSPKGDSSKLFIVASERAFEEELRYYQIANDGRILSEADIVVEGASGKKIVSRMPGIDKTYEGGSFSESHFVILNRGSNTFAITGLAIDTERPYVAIFEKVLSTFKFTE